MGNANKIDKNVSSRDEKKENVWNPSGSYDCSTNQITRFAFRSVRRLFTNYLLETRRFFAFYVENRTSKRGSYGPRTI